MSNNNYPFEWLDSLIEKLRSFPTDKYKAGSDAQKYEIDVLHDAEKEFRLLKQHIKKSIFDAAGQKKSKRQVVNYYHETITYYMNILYGFGQEKEDSPYLITQACSEVHESLRTLLYYLETQFCTSRKNRCSVPKYDLKCAKKDLKELLDRIVGRSKSLQCTYAVRILEIVTRSVEKFISTTNYSYPVTRQCLHYRLELLTKIADLPDWEVNPQQSHFPLDELLIFMNFNSKAYIGYLISNLSQMLNNTEASDKIAFLLEYYKIFRQIPIHPGYAFNEQYHSICDVLENWFTEEISYLFKRKELGFAETEVVKETTAEPKQTILSNKVLVSLSSDQIALLLRAADETRMLSARSLNAVFREIVPHISTEKKTDLSYKSVRTKSYNAEESDKEAAIRTLQKMIEKIQDY